MWKKNKYGNKKVVSDGYSFSSKLEGAVYQILKEREQVGEIKVLKTQDNVHLTRAKILYIADFKCIDLITNEEFWVEAKGMKTAVWAIKKRLWKYYGPGKLHMYEGSWNRPVLTEIINNE